MIRHEWVVEKESEQLTPLSMVLPVKALRTPVILRTGSAVLNIAGFGA